MRPRRFSLLVVAVVATLGGLGTLPAAAQTATDLVPFDQVNGIEVQTLTTDVADPTQLEFAPDGRLFIAERTGRIKIWREDGSLVEAGRIGVDSRDGQCSDCPGKTLDEGGLHGMLMAPDFDTTGHLYVYYSVPNSLGVAPVPAKHPGARGPASEEGKMRLSRFTVVGDRLDPASEQVVLENPAEWFHCCHYGGDMEWLADGTLLLTTGDDTISSQSDGYSPHDNREGQEFNNADLTSQNPADRRGKILRLNPDGSVPDDNPFVGDPAYDPYVYALGFRSPYRFEVEPGSQKLFVGNVGPDGIYPTPNRGPFQYDEVETVPAGGGTNHGWPRCIADNIAYNQYDWQTQSAGEPFDCSAMTPATLYYSYWPSTDFPVIAGGIGSTAMVGAIYDGQGPRALPARFRGQMIFMDFSRDHLWTVPVRADGTLDTGQIMPLVNGLTGPVELEVGPDGAVYVAEYGSGNYNSGASAISRIVCAGCASTSPPAAPSAGGAGHRVPVPAVALAGLLALTVPTVRRRFVAR